MKDIENEMETNNERKVHDNITTKNEIGDSIELKSPECPICKKKMMGRQWRWNIKVHIRSVHNFKGKVIIYKSRSKQFFITVS